MQIRNAGYSMHTAHTPFVLFVCYIRYLFLSNSLFPSLSNPIRNPLLFSFFLSLLLFFYLFLVFIDFFLYLRLSSLAIRLLSFSLSTTRTTRLFRYADHPRASICLLLIFETFSAFFLLLYVVHQSPF